MITLHLGPPPTAPLSLNQERTMHWRRRTARTAPWRDATFWAAKQAGLAAIVGAAPATVTVVLPVVGNRRRDPANFYPCVKAVVDGLVLAKVWPDDTPEFVSVSEPFLWRETYAEVRIVPRMVAAIGGMP